MSKEAARVLKNARRNGVSSHEAWEDLESLASEIEWDTEHVLSDEDTQSEASVQYEQSQ